MVRDNTFIYKITLTNSEDITIENEELTSELYSTISIFS
jgi:hypothetical protein